MFLKCLWFISSQNSKLVHKIESLSLNTRQGSEVVHFIVLAPKCHLNFGLHSILEKLIFWNVKIQSFFLTKQKLSIEHKYLLVSHVSPNVEDASPIHCIHFKPTKRDPHKSIKGLQVQLVAQLAFDCILFGKSSLTNSYT